MAARDRKPPCHAGELSDEAKQMDKGCSLCAVAAGRRADCGGRSKRRNAAGFDQSDQHLHGVHRDWLNEMATFSPLSAQSGLIFLKNFEQRGTSLGKKTKTKRSDGRKHRRTLAACSLYRIDQRLPQGLCGRKNLSRQQQGAVCAGTQLLLLSGCAGSLSHRLATGGAGQREIPIFLLCLWLFDAVRHFDGQVCLRMDLPVWTGAGPAAQDTALSQEKEPAGTPLFTLRKISGAGSLCHPAADDGGRCDRNG